MSPAAYLKGPGSAPAHFCAKTAFPSRAEARRQMRKVRAMGAQESMVAASAKDGPLYAYKCSTCHNYHLTHAKKGSRR